MKILFIVGASPNFMTIAPFIEAINRQNSIYSSDNQIEHILVHTMAILQIDAFSQSLILFPNRISELELPSQQTLKQNSDYQLRFK